MFFTLKNKQQFYIIYFIISQNHWHTCLGEGDPLELILALLGGDAAALEGGGSKGSSLVGDASPPFGLPIPTVGISALS